MAPHINGAGFTKKAPNQFGWRDLNLLPEKSKPQLPTPQIKKSLLNLIHISDTHICDAQSPARVEYLDRFADPHHPASALIGTLVGTYRSQEFLTAQVLESMVRSINQVTTAPVTGAAIDAVIVTGDLTDNAQINELNWFLKLMNGGEVRPDSGNHQKWEGPGGEHYSPFFWNPHGTPKGELEDFPRSLYGFPTIPDLLNAIRAPFSATGLAHKWLAVHGNHDALLQGTVAPDALLREIAIAGIKIFELTDEEALESLSRVSEIGPAQYPAPIAPITLVVGADNERDFVENLSWQRSFTGSNQPFILESPNTESAIKYWRKDFDDITLIALDTVNTYGGWQGSLDQLQFQWLKTQVEQSRGRYVVITSHHPLQDIQNGYTPFSEPRVLGAEIQDFLIEHSHVVAWICGHTHRHKVMYIGLDKAKGFWQIETASLIDWPQQGRIIEFFIDDSGDLSICSTALDHHGIIAQDYARIDLDDVDILSGLSRVLSLNDWQRREGKFAIEDNEGQLSDRSFIVKMSDRI